MNLLTSNIAEKIGSIETPSSYNVTLTFPKTENKTVPQTSGPLKCWTLGVRITLRVLKQKKHQIIILWGNLCTYRGPKK